ncbi:MAG: DUF885 family protein, partial [Caulobacteraceae bacterium]
MLDRRAFVATATAASAAVALTPRLAYAQPASAASLDALLAAFAQADLRRAPEEATSLGLDVGPLAGLRGKVSVASLEQIARDKADTAERLTRLRALGRRGLAGMPAVNYDTVDYIYALDDRANRRFDYGPGGSGAPYILSQLTGAYQQYPDFLDTQQPVATKSDAEDYLSRLEGFAGLLDQETEVARHDGGLGVIPPDFVLDRALGQMRALAATPADSSTVVASLVRRTREKGIPGDWRARALAIYDGKVKPAVGRQIDLLASWRPTATHDAGVWRLKDGEAYYAISLEKGTTTTLSPDEVHAIGLEQVASLGARIDAILTRQGVAAGPVGARIHGLYQDPKYRYPDTDAGKVQLIADLNRLVVAMQARLPRWFATLPKAPVEIRRVPKAIEAGAPGGYYNPGSLDGSRPGIYWINLRDTAEVPRWTLPTLTYHESIPGHHLQLSLQQEADLPLIRKVTFFSAYGEGWALYAEQLADEMGAYAGDPIGEVGYLQSALFRACRLVVDTGLHA